MKRLLLNLLCLPGQDHHNIEIVLAAEGAGVPRSLDPPGRLGLPGARMEAFRLPSLPRRRNPAPASPGCEEPCHAHRHHRGSLPAQDRRRRQPHAEPDPPSARPRRRSAGRLPAGAEDARRAPCRWSTSRASPFRSTRNTASACPTAGWPTAVKRFAPDVIHYVNPFAFGFRCHDVLRQRRRCGTPSVFSFHTLYGEFVKQYRRCGRCRRCSGG